MKKTQQCILELINSRKSLTVLEISQALNLTPANIRYHIKSLTINNLVEPVALRYPLQAGRPPMVFTTTKQSQINNFDILCELLLDELFLDKSHNNKMELLGKLAKKMNGSNTKTLLNLTQRLNALIIHLNKLNYEARWEAHADGPRIILNHCPFLTIITKYPQLCILDAFIIQEFIKTPTKHLQCLQRDFQGNIYCMFLVAEE